MNAIAWGLIAAAIVWITLMVVVAAPDPAAWGLWAQNGAAS